MLSGTIHNLRFRRTRTGYSAMSFQVIAADGKNISVAAAKMILPWEIYKKVPERFVFSPGELHAISESLDIMMRCVNLEKLNNIQALIQSIPSNTLLGIESTGGKDQLSGLFGNDDSAPTIEMLYAPKPNKQKVPEKDALLRIPDMLAKNGVINEDERLDFAQKIAQGLLL